MAQSTYLNFGNAQLSGANNVRTASPSTFGVVCNTEFSVRPDVILDTAPPSGAAKAFDHPVATTPQIMFGYADHVGDHLDPRGVRDQIQRVMANMVPPKILAGRCVHCGSSLDEGSYRDMWLNPQCYQADIAQHYSSQSTYDVRIPMFAHNGIVISSPSLCPTVVYQVIAALLACKNFYLFVNGTPVYPYGHVMNLLGREKPIPDKSVVVVKFTLVGGMENAGESKPSKHSKFFADESDDEYEQPEHADPHVGIIDPVTVDKAGWTPGKSGKIKNKPSKSAVRKFGHDAPQIAVNQGKMEVPRPKTAPPVLKKEYRETEIKHKTNSKKQEQIGKAKAVLATIAVVPTATNEEVAARRLETFPELPIPPAPVAPKPPPLPERPASESSPKPVVKPAEPTAPPLPERPAGEPKPKLAPKPAKPIVNKPVAVPKQHQAQHQVHYKDDAEKYFLDQVSPRTYPNSTRHCKLCNSNHDFVHDCPELRRLTSAKVGKLPRKQDFRDYASWFKAAQNYVAVFHRELSNLDQASYEARRLKRAQKQVAGQANGAQFGRPDQKGDYVLGLDGRGHCARCGSLIGEAQCSNRACPFSKCSICQKQGHSQKNHNAFQAAPPKQESRAADLHLKPTAWKGQWYATAVSKSTREAMTRADEASVSGCHVCDDNTFPHGQVPEKHHWRTCPFSENYVDWLKTVPNNKNAPISCANCNTDWGRANKFDHNHSTSSCPPERSAAYLTHMHQEQRHDRTPAQPRKTKLDRATRQSTKGGKAAALIQRSDADNNARQAAERDVNRELGRTTGLMDASAPQLASIAQVIDATNELATTAAMLAENTAITATELNNAARRPAKEACTLDLTPEAVDDVNPTATAVEADMRRRTHVTTFGGTAFGSRSNDGLLVNFNSACYNFGNYARSFFAYRSNVVDSKVDEPKPPVVDGLGNAVAAPINVAKNRSAYHKGNDTYICSAGKVQIALAILDAKTPSRPLLSCIPLGIVKEISQQLEPQISSIVHRIVRELPPIPSEQVDDPATDVDDTVTEDSSDMPALEDCTDVSVSIDSFEPLDWIDDFEPADYVVYDLEDDDPVAETSSMSNDSELYQLMWSQQDNNYRPLALIPTAAPSARDQLSLTKTKLIRPRPHRQNSPVNSLRAFGTVQPSTFSWVLGSIRRWLPTWTRSPSRGRSEVNKLLGGSIEANVFLGAWIQHQFTGVPPQRAGLGDRFSSSGQMSWLLSPLMHQHPHLQIMTPDCCVAFPYNNNPITYFARLCRWSAMASPATRFLRLFGITLGLWLVRLGSFFSQSTYLRCSILNNMSAKYISDLVLSDVVLSMATFLALNVIDFFLAKCADLFSVGYVITRILRYDPADEDLRTQEHKRVDPLVFGAIGFGVRALMFYGYIQSAQPVVLNLAAIAEVPATAGMTLSGPEYEKYYAIKYAKNSMVVNTPLTAATLDQSTITMTTDTMSFIRFRSEVRSRVAAHSLLI
jgi:hypothetical protein